MKKKTMKERALALVIALTMVFSLFPGSILAEDVVVDESTTQNEAAAVENASTQDEAAVVDDEAAVVEEATSGDEEVLPDVTAATAALSTDQYLTANAKSYEPGGFNLYDSGHYFVGSSENPNDVIAAAGDNYWIELVGYTTYAIMVTSGKNIRFDINCGAAFYSKSMGWSIYVYEGATLTISDTLNYDNYGNNKYSKAGILGDGVLKSGITNECGIYNAGTLNLNSGVISSHINSNDKGGGVYNEGTFIMSGGTIESNTAEKGGGVYNTGDFTMSGGTITSNTATSGGAVYNDGGTFTMKGGSITSNTAEKDGGIYINNGTDGTFNLSGAPEIKENKVGTDTQTDSNVYLSDGSLITIDEALNPVNLIGVTTEVAPTATEFVPFTSNGDSTDTLLFTSDTDYYVGFKDDHLQLTYYVAEVYADNTYLGYYTDLLEAIDAAQTGQTVKMNAPLIPAYPWQRIKTSPSI